MVDLDRIKVGILRGFYIAKSGTEIIEKLIPLDLDPYFKLLQKNKKKYNIY